MTGRKKMIVVLLALACIAAAAGGSIAYFTTERTTTVSVSASSVKIRATLLEEINGQRRTASAQVELLPGESRSRIAAADNIGGEDAWIRAQAAVSVTDKQQNTQRYPLGQSGAAEGLGAISAAGLNEGDWQWRDGYWYYKQKLAPGESTTALFTGLRFDGDIDNDYAGSVITLHVDMQATQTAHNGESALEAGGWPGE